MLYAGDVNPRIRGVAFEDDNQCPCGSGAPLAECCGRFVDGRQTPETAEQLMRSRFTAYCLKRVDYIVETTHPDTRTRNLNGEVAETADQLQWSNLQVLSTNQGQAKDKIGKVIFEADYVYNGKQEKHHERSRFRRFEGKWKYLDDKG